MDSRSPQSPANCDHHGETSTYCTRCWTNLYEQRALNVSGPGGRSSGHADRLTDEAIGSGTSLVRRGLIGAISASSFHAAVLVAVDGLDFDTLLPLSLILIAPGEVARGLLLIIPVEPVILSLALSNVLFALLGICVTCRLYLMAILIVVLFVGSAPFLFFVLSGLSHLRFG